MTKEQAIQLYELDKKCLNQIQKLKTILEERNKFIKSIKE